MYPFVFIFVLSLLIVGVVSECTHTGATAPAPWHAMMYSKLPDSWDMICGATLVTPTHVITAAHCFWTDNRRRSFNLASYEIFLGKQCEDYETLEEDMQLKRVKNITIHPWYRGVASSLQYDIAVVELDSAVTITSAVDVVHIGTDVQDLPVGTLGTVVGWEGSRTSRSMKTLQLPYLELTECRDSLSELHALPSSDMFCIGTGGVMRRRCLEDAGAGFVYVHPTTEKKYLRGVVSSFLLASFTVRCQDQDYIGVTNLAESHILEWIDQIIPLNVCQPSPCGPNSQCSDVNGRAVCACLPDYIGTVPNCRPECSDNSDCAGNSACARGKCVDPCTGRCGQNAACTVVNTTVVCSCQPGYSGDPLRSCSSLPVYGKSHGQTYYEGQLLDASASRYLGCFQDQGARTLPLSHGLLHKSNSPQQCIHFCAGFKYAGVEATIYCFCGNERPEATLSQAVCNTNCPGDRTKTCGGDWALDVYTVPPSRRPNIVYKGCFRDAEKRVLAGSYGHDINLSLTPYQCASLCHGYKYAGLQYSNQCFCGDTMKSQKIPEDQCNLKCTGDDTKMCGGHFANSVYEMLEVPVVVLMTTPSGPSKACSYH